MLPEYESAWYYLALSETRSGNPNEGIIAMQKAVELNPNKFGHNEELGNMLTQSGRYEEAVAPLKKALSLKPNDFKTMVGIGLALFESSQHEEALNYLMQADRMRPGNQIVQMFMNVSRSRQQGLAKVSQLKDAADKNPLDRNVRMQLVNILSFARRLDEAEKYIQEIVKTNPKDYRYYQHIGVTYSTANKFDKAIAMFKKALELKDEGGSHMNLAAIYSKQGRIDEAIRAYEKVLELKPDAAQTMLLYAKVLFENGKLRKALSIYKRSLSMMPNQPIAIYQAGMLSARFGDTDNARQYLETLKSLDADDAKSLARYIRFRSR